MTAAYYDDPNYVYGSASRYYDEQPSDFDQDRLIWRFEVAWKGGMAYFSEANGETEINRAIACSWSRGRSTWVNYDNNGLVKFEPGRMIITLLDPDGRYDPYNENSPLYGFIEPGKYCRLIVRLNESLNQKHRFAGIVEDVNSYLNENKEKCVDIAVTCGWGVLQGYDIFLPTISNTDLSSAFLNVLNAAAWPNGWGSSMQRGPAVLPYFWSNGADGRMLLHNAAYTLGSRVFIRGDGKFHYTSRATPEPTPAAYITQQEINPNIPVSNPWKSGCEVVELGTKSIGSLNAQGTVWGDTVQFNPLVERLTQQVPEFAIESGQTFRLSGGYSLPSNASFPTDGRFLFAYNTNFPDAKFLYQFNSNSIFEAIAGVDVTNYIVCDEFFDAGTGFQAVIRNTFPTTVYMRRIAVVHQAYQYLERGATVFSKSVRSLGKKVRTFKIDAPFMIDANRININSVLTWYFKLLTTQWKLPVIRFDSRPEKQFVDIMDVIYLDAPAKNIADTFRVGRIEERWIKRNGQAVETVVQTEPSFYA